MKRIDIIGAPGAGKSTILNCLVKKRKKGSWLQSSEAFNKVIAEHFSLTPQNLMDYINNYGYKLLKGRPKLPLNEKKYSEFLSVNTQKYNFVIESAFEFFYKDDVTPPHIKAKRMGWLVQTLERITLLEHYCKGTVVFDESLSSKLFSFVIDHAKSEDKGSEYLSHFNLPEGFIYIRLEYEEVLSRLENRPRITFDHARMNEQERQKKCLESIENAERASACLTEYGVEGLILDGKRSIEENTELITNFLEDIN